MDNILLLDLGNSSLKWTFVQDDRFDVVGVLSHQYEVLEQQLESVWSNIQAPNAVWVTSVANRSLQKKLTTWIEHHWSISSSFMRTERKVCGVTCAYQKTEDLGVDRWAAILAAYHYYPQGVCVVDCGTAITLDVVHRDGRHLGGYILPGFESMRQILFSKTAIAVTGNDQSMDEWGDSTASCIALGGRKAVTSLVESSVESLQVAGVCDPALVLTGGSVNEIGSLMEIDYEIRDQLVLEGLLMYVRGKTT